MKALSMFIFHIQLEPDLHLGAYTGRIVHGAFLQFLRTYDEELTIRLHTKTSRRPYTTSEIEYYNRERSVGSFQVLTFDKDIIKSLINKIALDDTFQIFIVDRFLPIISIEYKKVEIKEPRTMEIDTTFRVRFKTPIIFASSKRKAKTDPYPHLKVFWKQMLGPYSRVVKELSEIDIMLLVEKLYKQLATPHFVIRSRHVRPGHKIRTTGFNGTILFKVEDNEGLDDLHVILQIAELWGIGSKTTMGFGRIAISLKPHHKKQKKFSDGQNEKNKTLEDKESNQFK